MIEWNEWSEKVIEREHGKIYFYRELYEGNHSQIFSRAKDLIEKGEIVDIIGEKQIKTINVRSPYIVANICKLIPEIPATLVSRSIGKIKSSIKSTDEQNEAANESSDEIIDGPRGDAADNRIENLQDEIIQQIAKNSNLRFEHWSNIVQHQVDGGIVAVPWKDERGIRIDFKKRDVYFPHEDGLGADLAYDRKIAGHDYLHVYRERWDKTDLETEHMLFRVKEGNRTEPVEDAEAIELLGLEQLKTIFMGRSRPFIQYWANEKTMSFPLGTSALKGQESKQEEINWTLTRAGITFERNGKPRLTVPQKTFEEAQDKAYERYKNENLIDHRDFEITTYDEQGKALALVQIDTTKIGDMTWVKELVQAMLIETKTSQKAVDFYMDGGAPAQSGVAKFYDLFVSIIKAENIQAEYIYLLQQLFESCLWLANQDDPAIIIEEPEITLNGMMPVNRKELVEENNKEYTDGTASLETTVRRNNPHASEEWIQEELARIEEGAQGDDTVSLLAGRQTLGNLQDNRDKELVTEDDEEVDENV
ncbi:hypothetical protein ACFFJY_09290 [Fictibacillus aquaticus]|uniref:Phage portal protein n=1 Tax=Fictibacillus aquaticus TaxID=2021314 RepID=A0A235FF53_9BACL|nr:hypothetical protein [Fictibacillus aquaticus]OYD59779.1 hypothetical protein CGZ90_00780 [Fictibacillus aquaticus]